MVAAAVCTAIASIGATSAQAGVWMRSTCINPGGSPAPSEGWSSFSAGIGAGSDASARCAPDMYALLSMRAAVAVGGHETLVYTPPPGSSLIGGVVGVNLLADGGGYNASGVAAVYTPEHRYDGSNVVMQCAAGLTPCATGAHHYVGPVTLPARRGGQLFVSASCGGTPGYACNAGGSHGVWSRALVSYANLLLESDAAPTARDFRGSIFEPGAHGTARISFQAAVASGPGIFRVRVTIDGEPVYDATPDPNGGRCVPASTDPSSRALVFAYQQPCRHSLTFDHAVDTATLDDGAHELRIVITDAAQNSQTVLRQTITTDNRSPVTSASTSPPPRRSEPAPSVSGPALAAPVVGLSLRSPSRALSGAVRHVWARSGLRLAGAVTTAAGAPAAGIPVALFAQSARDAAPRRVARAVTDAAGRWRLRGPRGPSRTLTISSGRRPDPGSPQSIKIRQVVRPRVSLRVTALGAGSMRFEGRLQMDPLGRRWPFVMIQSWFNDDGGGWLNVRRIRVKASGAYARDVVGQVTSVGGSYKFRAVTSATSLYASGVSAIRRARVR